MIDGLGDRLVLDAALATLSEESRAAVVLRDVANLDYAEIAAILDIPIGTVKSRISRGGPHSPPNFGWNRSHRRIREPNRPAANVQLT